MPGIIVFNRRWSVGSDDLVVPAAVLIVLHTVWIIVLAVVLNIVEFESDNSCGAMLKKHILGFLVILCVSVIIEMFGAWMSMRGTILNTEPRSGMHYVLYVRLGVFIIEIVWQVVGVVWIAQHFVTCSHLPAKHAILGIIVCNWIVMLCIVISIWCTFDAAGHSWVKLKRYQESMKGRELNSHQKRCSGNSRRNWRHRKAMRKYEQSWDRRCRFLFCCIKDDKHRHSFAEVAKLFTEFFRDLDVVPSDIVAGLVLLRKHQQLHRRLIISQDSNDIYQFLSGVAVTPSTKFVNLQLAEVRTDYKKVVHYMRYALAAYGWPVYMMMNTGTGLCKIMPHLRGVYTIETLEQMLHPRNRGEVLSVCTCCCYLCCKSKKGQQKVVDDNCCQCNFAALCKLTGLNHLDLIYATYHVDIGETPFFIAVDHEERTIIISIRGTLSLQDVLTDLKADAEMLPVEPVREDWLAHKGMVQAAVYIRKKIKEEMLLSDAFSRDMERGTQNYDLVVVGHSLGAGTAAILAILMKQEFPSLHCYAYSPPGGLLSMTCVEETKSFITAVIVGKDFVPRIGLHQLEALRQDLINVIKKSADPKWKIIMSSMLCCCKEKSKDLRFTSTIEMSELMKQEKESRNFFHPADTQIALSTHTPLYLPGKILHIVRNHNQQSGCWTCGSEEPIYEAIWADNADFDEVLISPAMANDHLPDKVLEALEKALTSPPMPHDVPPCNSFDAVSEEREPNAARGSAAAAAANGAAEDHSSSVLFFISSENQILPSDNTSRKESTEPILLDPILETHSVINRPPMNPKLSLPLKYSGFPASALSTNPHSQEAVPLASPEAFSDTCSLSVLDYGSSKRGTKSSPDPMGVRRSSSLPSTNPHAPLQKRCSSPPKHDEQMHDDTQLLNCFRDSANLNKPGASAVLEQKDSMLLFHSEYGCKPQAVTNSPKEFAVSIQNDSFTMFDSPSANECEIVTLESQSPDRDSLRLQFLYDDYLGHYSPAGRGYPHGFSYCTEHTGFELPDIHGVVRPSCGLTISPEFKVSQQIEFAGFSKSLDYENHPDLKVVNSDLS